jgi:ribosomal protein S4E
MLRILILLLSLFLALPAAAQDKPKTAMPTYEKGNKKNPFIPIITNDGQLLNIEEENKEVNFVLEGIIYDKEGNSMAIINGQILGKNDTILDAKIVEVRKDSVVYVKDEEIFVLNAKKEE